MTHVSFSPRMNIFRLPPNQKQFFETCVSMLRQIEEKTGIQFSCSLESHKDTAAVYVSHTQGSYERRICSIIRKPSRILFLSTCSADKEISLVMPFTALMECFKDRLCFVLKRDKDLTEKRLETLTRQLDSLSL